MTNRTTINNPDFIHFGVTVAGEFVIRCTKNGECLEVVMPLSSMRQVELGILEIRARLRDNAELN